LVESKVKSKVDSEALDFPIAITGRVASASAIDFARALWIGLRAPRLSLRQSPPGSRRNRALSMHTAAAGLHRIVVASVHRRLRLPQCIDSPFFKGAERSCQCRRERRAEFAVWGLTGVGAK
jgi:hypothetical protein